MSQRRLVLGFWLALPALGLALGGSVSLGQQPGSVPVASQAPAPAEPKPADTKPTEEKPAEVPAQIELLETRVRFEVNGDSRKEVHARVRINNELGARQFARLNFDYNRAFQQVELPLMRITHASGGTAEILPGAISDQPNPAVVNFAAYHDVRVKSVRILGLEPGDLLEYRVVTTTTGNFGTGDVHLSHDFSREGVVALEVFDIDLPASWTIKPVTSGTAEGFGAQQFSDASGTRMVYRWKRSFLSGTGAHYESSVPEVPNASPQADIVLSKDSWAEFSFSLQKSFRSADSATPILRSHAQELTKTIRSPEGKLAALYDFVSQKIQTVDLPLGATRFRTREPEDVMASGYAIPEDKAVLLSELARLVDLDAAPALVLGERRFLVGSAIPERLTNILVVARFGENTVWLDPSLEIAPYGLVASRLRGKPALLVSPPNDIQFFENISSSLPFPATQLVDVNARLGNDGTLHGKVKYAMRGDNELLLRVAFHQAPKEKWKEVAQLLALSDGFRGTVTSVTASDPYATKEAFVVEYEITQPKFVDWARNPVRIPALLPLVALPDPPVRAADGAGSSPIELGTPLDVQTRVTLHVPPDTGVRAPVGTSVARDYATFSSEYSAHDLTLTAERHIKFLRRQVPGEHGADYAAFVRTVQNDQAQEFTLERGVAVASPAAQQKATKAKP